MNHINPKNLAAISQILAKRDIYVYGTKAGALQQVPIKRQPSEGTGRFASVLFSKVHVTAINSQDALNKEHNPYREITLKRYLERKDPFWWNVMGKAELSPRVVRGWAIRRTRVAFTSALERRGYDKDGNMMKRALPVTGQKPEKDLFGTMLFMVSKDTVTASFEELNHELDIILDAVLKLAAKPAKPLKPTGPASNRASKSNHEGRARIPNEKKEKDGKVTANTPFIISRPTTARPPIRKPVAGPSIRKYSSP